FQSRRFSRGRTRKAERLGHQYLVCPVRHPAFAERDVMEYFARGRADHSALILAARITLPHFSVSSAISLPKSAGEPASTVPPSSASRAFILGSASAVLISALSFPMISRGVFLGAQRPTHWLASKPLTKLPTVGISGSTSERIAVVTAKARSLP